MRKMNGIPHEPSIKRPQPPPHPAPAFKDLLRIALLKIIEKEGEIHGLRLHDELKNKYGIVIPRPVIYRALRALEADGLVVSRWSVKESGPAKRLYRITEEGEEFLKQRIHRVKKVLELVKKILEE